MLIDLYKEAPCLWQVKSSLYKDRVLRIQEFEKISKEMEKVDPTMNVEKILVWNCSRVYEAPVAK